MQSAWRSLGGQSGGVQHEVLSLACLPTNPLLAEFTRLCFPSILSIAMWLINVESRELECFNDDRNLPPYAILSHTWTGLEVTMQQYRDTVAGVATRDKQIETLPGLSKINISCVQARADKLPYLWVDTCCIDKTSSAELSEAINSMFRWYRLAQVCYVYLEDFEASSVQDSTTDGVIGSTAARLADARWFTRGWTLQELVAPHDMVFYDRSWVCFGTKDSLRLELSRITGIDRAYLSGADLTRASVATRMSWAAMRVTTKVEDMAYSLFGIFDVNMPLLYGEGHKAFVRLQEEILKDNDDQSLFAWQPTDATIVAPPHLLSNIARDAGVSVFAQHPRQFLVAAKVGSYPSASEPSIVGGRGLKIQLPLFRIYDSVYSQLRVAVLSCGVEYPRTLRVGIIVQKLFPGHYMRHPFAGLVRVDAREIRMDGGKNTRQMYIRKAITWKIPFAPLLDSSPREDSIRVEWF